MFLKRQLFNALAALFLALTCQEALAELVATSDNAISNLYDNLLQREYAGPVVFPNHQVERKAQRSPSLRLRFGRRSDPDMLPASVEKRWFGDVNQKPIRSPSLRLRFGRRSDPSMPLHSSYDALLNDMLAVDDNVVDNDNLYDEYERVVRKPTRLRWGRSVPYEDSDSRLAQLEDREQQRQRTDEFLNSLMSSEKMRNIVLNLNPYDTTTAEDNESNEFQREIRKQQPLRLRWGRSTGGRSNVGDIAGTEPQHDKKSLSQNAVNVNKAPTTQQDKN